MAFHSLTALLCTSDAPMHSTKPQHIMFGYQLLYKSGIIVTTPVVAIVVVARPSSCSSLAPLLPTLLPTDTTPRSDTIASELLRGFFFLLS